MQEHNPTKSNNKGAVADKAAAPFNIPHIWQKKNSNR